MNRNVPISAIGSVRPVITVVRHEARNRNTITIVSAAPSSSVLRTFLSRCGSARVVADDLDLDARVQRLQSRPSSFSAAVRPSTTSIVFCPCALMMSSDSALAVHQRHAVLLLLAVDHLGDLGQVHRLAAAPRDDDAVEVLRRRAIRPCICTTCSSAVTRIAPAGTSWFSLRSAAMTWSTPTSSASIAAGLRRSGFRA